MELSSLESQHLRHLMERLELVISTIERIEHGDRTLNMVRSDLSFISEEISDMLAEADAPADEFRMETLPVLKPTPPPPPPCEHEKVYAPFLHTGMQPMMPWICEKCLKQGQDPGWHIHLENKDKYRVLLNEIIKGVKRGEI